MEESYNSSYLVLPLSPSIACSVSCSDQIQNGLPFWCRLTQVILKKRPLIGRSSSLMPRNNWQNTTDKLLK